MKDGNGNRIRMEHPGPNTPVPAGTEGVVASFNTGRGWEIEWETGVSTFFPGNGDEITTMAPGDGPGWCDFCPSPEPRWEHRCADSSNVLTAIRESGRVESIGQGSLGSWAACEACHRLIEAGKVDKLARRATKRIIATGGNSDLPFAMVLLGVRQAHAMYWRHRVGPGFPIRRPTSIGG